VVLLLNIFLVACIIMRFW